MQNPAADLAIRLRRAAFNRALEQGDLDAITPILAPNVTLITGTDSALLNGRKAQLLAWKREFAAPADQRSIYVRTPETIIVSTIEPIAMEHGSWRGTTVAGEVQASGTYAAKWRNLSPMGPDANWVLVAEIFVTLT